MSFQRYAVYYRPAEGAFATFGAQWLGWDSALGKQVRSAPIEMLAGAQDILTRRPRGYGLHGTLKAPFRLNIDTSEAKLMLSLNSVAAKTAPVSCDSLAVRALGGFLALVPEGDAAGIGRVAATCVTELDGFRAPLSENEIAKRRKSKLSKRQAGYLATYGYPYVLEDYEFHMTLTGRVSAGIETLEAVMAEALHGLRPRPFVLDEITLMGEDDQGRFHDLERFKLEG